jgi:RecB family endonuclease NucS
LPAKTAKVISEKIEALPLSIEELTIKNKESLQTIVVEELWKIENGLSVIGCEVPADDKVIDILCHDQNGQLMLIMLGVTEDDAMLFEGLQTLNEVNRIRQMLKYFNKEKRINEKEPARLVLVAPSFSTNLLTIASGISNVKMSLYEWEYLQFGENKALRMTQVSLSEAFKNKK